MTSTIRKRSSREPLEPSITKHLNLIPQTSSSNTTTDMTCLSSTAKSLEIATFSCNLLFWLHFRAALSTLQVRQLINQLRQPITTAAGPKVIPYCATTIHQRSGLYHRLSCRSTTLHIGHSICILQLQSNAKEKQYNLQIRAQYLYLPDHHYGYVATRSSNWDPPEEIIINCFARN